MYSSVRNEIPEFLKDQAVYCDNLIHGQHRKSCLILARNLKFWEFQRKQLLHCIDLNETILGKEARRIRSYQGPQSRCFKSRRHELDESAVETSTLAESTLQQDTQTPPDISFGKYMYTNCGEAAKLYLLLSCWDKFLVLQRLTTATGEVRFEITAEWEQVTSYKLVHGKLKFHAVVEITFADGTQRRTDFNDDKRAAAPTDAATTSAAAASSPSNKDFKALLERVRSAKTELQLHRATTQKEFERLRDTQAFGRDLLRSLKLEEKQMLARCGDIWMRFIAADDALVIGVPLVNNCAAPNLTILRNLRAVFKIDSEALVRGITYKQRLYKLQQRFENLETLETFFQCATDEDEDDNDDEKLSRRRATWTCGGGAQERQQQMLPESFAVLILHLRISQIIAVEERCPLFLLFEVEKNMDLGTGPKTKIYEQQIFLQNFNFSDILRRRQSYEVQFSQRTLHQDFLAIACASMETKLLIKFISANDLAKFEQLLAAKFDCEMLKRGSDDDDNDGGDENSSDTSMQMGNEEDNENSVPSSAQFFKHSVFFNRKPASLWHGLLALRVTSAPDAAPLYGDLDTTTSTSSTLWKFYTPNAERAFLLVKLLFEELILNRCNVAHIACPTSHTFTPADNVNVLELENAMRLELSALLQLINETKNKSFRPKMKYSDLAKLQMQTDLLAASLG